MVAATRHGSTLGIAHISYTILRISRKPMGQYLPPLHLLLHILYSTRERRTYHETIEPSPSARGVRALPGFRERQDVQRRCAGRRCVVDQHEMRAGFQPAKSFPVPRPQVVRHQFIQMDR